MKKVLILFIVIFIFQKDIDAQNCSYLLLKSNAELEMSMFDKKGKPSGKVIYKVISSNGTEAKVSSKVFNEKGKEITDAEGTYKCDGNNFSYAGGMKIMTMGLKVTDRKVEDKEIITTPAGKFDCYKITSNQSIKSIFNFNIQTTEWFAPNTGIIKTEVYRKGELTSTSMVTKISN